MSIDYESLKDKAVVLAQSGVTKAKELTDTGISKAKELADVGVAKAREVSEIGKLKVQNSTEQEAIRKAYSDLGKLYYAERGSAPEAAYADLCQHITDALARISYNNERIADIKAAGRISGDEGDVVEEPVDTEAGESCCCGTEESAEETCCCGTEEPAAEGPCCCGGEEPAAEDGESCCCGAEESPAEDDTPAE